MLPHMPVRFTTRGMLLFIAFFAFVAACLLVPTLYGAMAAFTVAIAVMLFASTGALVAPPERRVFWVGFTMFGWGYFVVSRLPDEGYATAFIYLSGYEYFPVEGILRTCYYDYLRYWMGHADPDAGLNLNAGDDPRGDFFLTAGKSISIILVAHLGGLLTNACFRYHSREQPNTE
jgi:hypothetical protein